MYCNQGFVSGGAGGGGGGGGRGHETSYNMRCKTATKHFN